MKHNHMRKSCLVLGAGAAVLASALLWSTPLIASDYSFSGESNTIFRMRTTVDDKILFPAYEYLRLNMTDKRSDGSGVSFYLGAWGRGDLGDKVESSRTDGDIQYAYLTYRAPKNNTAVTVGRQFISEGVATERIDGLYLRNDFQYGFGAASFIGNSVITEPNAAFQFQGGTLVYGARISQSNKKYYNIGLSALKGESDGDNTYREEEGVDLWLHPLQSVDFTGRSTYNSLTDGWMEHSYAVSYTPVSSLRFGVDFSRTNFKNYMYAVTTPALSYLTSMNQFNPSWKKEAVLTSVSPTVAYTGIKNFTISADYKFYSYNYFGNGDASYYGCKTSYLFTGDILVGGAIHRMDSIENNTGKLNYTEYRAFASKKIGHTDLTVDAINVNYDESINGISNSYAITGAAGYEFNRKLKVGADLEYARNPDFDREVRALVKATYTFDTKFAAEGGTKSEK